MIPIKILDETAPLESVVLGIAHSMGGTPDLERTFDPKSRAHVLSGTFPKEENLELEINAVKSVFEKYGVEVLRPESIENLNQVFARDIAFVIEDTMIIPCVTHERKMESDGIDYITSKVEKVLLPNEPLFMEGGDIIPWKGKLFVGYSKKEDFEKYTVARTNEQSLQYLTEKFPRWEVHGLELKKSDNDPLENTLHLDCCFQPVGENKAVLYKEGLKKHEDADFLIALFGVENIFEITKEEMYHMNANFFSIRPDVVISDSGFSRLNKQFKDWGIKVESVAHREVAKMEGLFRCTTMPLRRRYV